MGEAWPVRGGPLLATADLVATAVFALEGALAGIVAGLDVLGVLVLGIVTASAGGVIRDLLIGDVPPLWVRRPRFVLAAVAAGLVGAITGVGGGTVRDILLDRVPAVLRIEVYAAAALAGAAVMVFAERGGARRWQAMVLGAALCFAIRVTSAAADWNLPTPGR